MRKGAERVVFGLSSHEVVELGLLHMALEDRA